MEAAGLCNIQVPACQTTRYHIPEHVLEYGSSRPLQLSGLQHKLIGFYNRDEKCLQRGTDWVFKYSGLRFVFKGLKVIAPPLSEYCNGVKLRCPLSLTDCICTDRNWKQQISG
jgi:hypothetical protein